MILFDLVEKPKSRNVQILFCVLFSSFMLWGCARWSGVIELAPFCLFLGYGRLLSLSLSSSPVSREPGFSFVARFASLRAPGSLTQREELT
jgi:hypothetical protein